MAATTLKEAIVQALNKAASAFYTPQTLTPEQQEQARTNIGAMSAATSPSVPAGTLLPFAGTAVPDGYLLCNGANVSRTDYANLFAAIGTKWGEGDGSTTFTLPNFNNRFIEGTTDTEKVGQYLEAGAPNITGCPGITDESYKMSNTAVSGAFVVHTKGDPKKVYGNFYSYVDGNVTTMGFPYLNAASQNYIFGAGTVRPPSAQTLIMIKA